MFYLCSHVYKILIFFYVSLPFDLEGVDMNKKANLDHAKVELGAIIKHAGDSVVYRLAGGR